MSVCTDRRLQTCGLLRAIFRTEKFHFGLAIRGRWPSGAGCALPITLMGAVLSLRLPIEAHIRPVG